MLGKTMRCGAALVAAVLMNGCGGESQKDLDLAQASVRSALEAWKQGESAKALKNGSSAVEFHDDDWQAGARLVNFELTKTYLDTDGAPRCAVTLTVQRRGNKEDTIEITYHVKTAPTVVIARDPYS